MCASSCWSSIHILILPGMWRCRVQHQSNGLICGWGVGRPGATGRAAGVRMHDDDTPGQVCHHRGCHRRACLGGARVAPGRSEPRGRSRAPRAHGGGGRRCGGLPGSSQPLALPTGSFGFLVNTPRKQMQTKAPPYLPSHKHGKDLRPRGGRPQRDGRWWPASAATTTRGGYPRRTLKRPPTQGRRGPWRSGRAAGVMSV